MKAAKKTAISVFRNLFFFFFFNISNSERAELGLLDNGSIFKDLLNIRSWETCVSTDCQIIFPGMLACIILDQKKKT